MKYPNEQNLSIYIKTTRSFELRFTRDGIVEDITGWTVFFTVKNKLKDTDEQAVIKKDITEHLDSSNGITSIDLSAEDTDQDAKSYYYDIKFKDAEGNSGILAWGKITFKLPVTQRNE